MPILLLIIERDRVDLHNKRRNDRKNAMKYLGKNPYSWPNKIIDGLYVYFKIFRMKRLKPIKFVSTEISRQPETTFIKNEFSLTNSMNEFGSDKGNYHGYTEIYQDKLEHKRFEINRIVEIGVGTADLTIPSNMGPKGVPGASLRAWRSYAPNAQIIGADIDTKVLFQEDRINTYYLDQLNLRSFPSFLEKITSSIDLLVIDGLHTPRADFNTVVNLLPYLAIDGDCFIEDVGNISSKYIWPVVLNQLNSRYISKIQRRQRGNIIHIRRMY